MAERIPGTALDLFQKPVLGHLATLMPDGTPQVTPLWVDYDGTNILINTVKGRRKELNMRQHPQVGLDMVDPDNEFHFIAIRGKVIEITTEGANDHIDQFAQRYLNVDKYPYHNPGDVREICKIEPERVIAQ